MTSLFIYFRRVLLIMFFVVLASCTGGSGDYLGGFLGSECAQTNERCDSSYVETTYDSVVTCCEADQFCRKATPTSTYETCN